MQIPNLAHQANQEMGRGDSMSKRRGEKGGFKAHIHAKKKVKGVKRARK